eukprot:966953_1
MATATHTDPWDVIKTVSGVLFDDNFNVDIDAIQKAYESKTNAIQVLENNWQENVLYQLLLTVLKDKNTNIAEILQDFIAMAPNDILINETSTFNACNLRQMIYILITRVFNLLSSDITPYIRNKMVQYFVDNNINGRKFSKITQNTFVNDLTSCLNHDKAPTDDVLTIVHRTLSSFQDQSIFECKICYRIQIATECKDTPIRSNKIRCVGCNSVVSTVIASAECKTESPSVHAQGEAIGTKIVKLFDSRSDKSLDTVFPALMALLQDTDRDALISIKHDNYRTCLENKSYDMIVKSFIPL